MLPVLPIAEAAAPGIDTFGFTGNQLLVWLAILFFVIGLANQAFGLIEKFTSSKADKPVPLSEQIVTQNQMNERMTGLSGKVDRNRQELSGQIEGMQALLLAKIEESMAAGQRRVDDLRKDFHTTIEGVKEKIGEVRGEMKGRFQ